MIVIILPKKITRNKIRLYNGKYDCISSVLYLEINRTDKTSRPNVTIILTIYNKDCARENRPKVSEPKYLLIRKINI